MSKRVFFPTRFNARTAHEEPQHLAGYTGDGKVVLTAHGRALSHCEELTPDAASALAHELLSAIYDAQQQADKAAGLHEWVSHPLPDGRFRVAYRGHAATFRAITNSKRHTARRFADPSQAPTGYRCPICHREAPQGATMYVLDESTIDPKKWEPEATSLRGYRVCQTCMRPELAAATIGAALLATKETP